MSNRDRPSVSTHHLRSEHGFTLIELLISMVMMTVLTLATFSFLQFTTEDVSHITDRVHVDQTGRTALENIMLELHSTCVTTPVIPIQEGSTENIVKFISESGSESTFTILHKHEIIFTPAAGTTEGTLIEKSYPSTGGTAPNYTWSATPTTTKLLTGIKRTEYGGTTTPVFQYYRYYKEGDAIPTGDATLPYGEINPLPVTGTLSKTAAEGITKATVSFTLAPEGKESVAFNHDRPVALTDSVIFRLAPSSEASSNTNVPCSEKT
jgi:prepilin-type N-terminal cleavage/methylation domain-containing protein